MKKYLFLLLILSIGKSSIAQHNPDSLLFLQHPTVPPFKLTKISDSTLFSKDDLKKKRATIMILFSPDCEHCQQETKDIIANIGLFKKTQIVMASPLEYHILRKFYDDYKIADHPTITMGRDPSYFLGTFYQVRSFPTIFIYNKKGKLVNWFRGSTPIEKILGSL